MKKTVLGITWAAAQNFWWLPLFCLVIVFIIYRLRKYKSIVRMLVASRWTSVLLKNYSEQRLILKSCLAVFAFVFIFCALLQPQWGKKEQMVKQEGRELFVALDISRSMLASDVKPNRLAFAKSKIKQLLKLLPSERVGLLVFSGAAVVQCPLTRDTGLFTMFLSQLDAESISSGTTALDQAINKVIALFQKLPSRNNKILVIFTDGEDFSRDLTAVREQANTLGLHIFTYGVGTEQGAPVPIVDEQGVPVGYEKNEQGNVVLSRLNPGILQALSRETGGRFISPTQSNDDLKSLVTEVEKYEKEKFEDKELATQEERYPYFLVGTFVCMVLEWLL